MENLRNQHTSRCRINIAKIIVYRETKIIKKLQSKRCLSWFLFLEGFLNRYLLLNAILTFLFAWHFCIQRDLNSPYFDFFINDEDDWAYALEKVGHFLCHQNQNGGWNKHNFFKNMMSNLLFMKYLIFFQKFWCCWWNIICSHSAKMVFSGIGATTTGARTIGCLSWGTNHSFYKIYITAPSKWILMIYESFWAYEF